MIDSDSDMDICINNENEIVSYKDTSGVSNEDGNDFKKEGDEIDEMSCRK